VAFSGLKVSGYDTAAHQCCCSTGSAGAQGAQDLTDPNPGCLTGRLILRLQCAQAPMLGQPTAPRFGYSESLTAKLSRASRGESAGKTKRWL